VCFRRRSSENVRCCSKNWRRRSRRLTRNPPHLRDRCAHRKSSVRFTSTTRKVYAAGIALALALAVLRMYGLTVADLARMARAKFIESVADAKAATSREYSDRV